MNLLPLALAYLLAGVVHVAKDFLEPPYNRPGYIRDRRYALMTAIGLLWLPWTIRMFFGYATRRGWRGIQEYFWSEAALRYAVFFAAWGALHLLLN